MGEHPTYRIETVADFDQVPDESIEACLADFASFIAMRRLATAFVDPAVAKPTDTFTWIDDGVAGVSAVRFTDPDTGEVLLNVPVPATDTTEGA